jgi:hypothetical protein
MSPNESDWITNAVDDARRGKTTTPDAMWAKLKALLKTTLIQKPLPAMELQKIAMELIKGAETLEHHSNRD